MKLLDIDFIKSIINVSIADYRSTIRKYQQAKKDKRTLNPVNDMQILNTYYIHN